jgi:hypothetical protein
MITGDKQVSDDAPVANDSAGMRVLAVVILGLAAGLVYFMVNLKH